MIENLIELLPQQRLAPIYRELILLHPSAERTFVDLEARTIADEADYQGLGGTRLDYIMEKYGLHKTQKKG